MPDEPLRLLAIDDDPAALEILRVVAQVEGFEFSGFGDGATGMAAVREVDPDVVCLDVRLPDTTGHELCRRLKSDTDTRLTPVLLVTSFDDQRSRIQGIEAGCDDFLAKPIDRLEVAARARVLAQVRRANRDLEEGERVLRALALSVEARDDETGEHCERVGTLAARLGEWVGLSAESIRALRQAGTLHDIGKIGVPDSILRKPGKLTASEWEVMRAHPVVGEAIVRPLRSLRAVLPVIRHHHERWDGGGYPDGLAGDDIPVGARVFQVADAFDALTTNRPYRAALPIDGALDVLVSEAELGKWDPNVVRTFVERVDRAGLLRAVAAAMGARTGN